MALKNCRECRKKVSTEALTCPNCGVPNPTAKQIKEKKDDSLLTKMFVTGYDNEKTSNLKSTNFGFARCEKNFCKNRYKTLKVPKKLIGKQVCKICGNIMEEVKEEDAIKDIERSKYKLTKQEFKSNTDSTFERVWNGSLPLGQTFWLFYVLVNFVVGFVAGFLIEMYQAKWIFIIPVLTTIWAGVGTWKSATNYQYQKLKLQQTYGWASATKVVIVFGFISLLGQLGNLLK